VARSRRRSRARSAILYLLSYAIGTPALVLLMGHRIDVNQHAVLALVSLIQLFATAMRWRSESRRTTPPVAMAEA
jgi:NhaP-type Na+/H+ or K+/H+ antiporter